MFNEIEQKLEQTIKQLVCTAIEKMQQYVNTELQRIVAMIDKLAARVVQLERNVDMDAQNGVSERSGSDSGSNTNSGG